MCSVGEGRAMGTLKLFIAYHFPLTPFRSLLHEISDMHQCQRTQSVEFKLNYSDLDHEGVFSLILNGESQKNSMKNPWIEKKDAWADCVLALHRFFPWRAVKWLFFD